jgi:hypothetical protein
MSYSIRLIASMNVDTKEKHPKEAAHRPYMGG